ncbi:MAG: hypothetical protein ACE5JU_15120 [Candidatus Binatia bacterium]
MASRPRKPRNTCLGRLRVGAVEDQQAKGTWTRKKRFFRDASLVLIMGIMAYSLFASDLHGGSGPAGEPAPDVTLNTVDGEFRLSQQRGKVLLLYFSFPG